MIQLHFPWVAAAILLPLVGAGLIAQTDDRSKASRIGLAASVLALVSLVGGWLDLVLTGANLAQDPWDLWGRALGHPVLVIDQLNAPLLAMAALITSLTILSTLRTKIHRFSFGLALVADSLVIAIFSCRDAWVLIGLLLLSVLIPWSEIRARGHSTRVFVIHMSLFAITLVSGQLLVDRGSVNLGGALLMTAVLVRCGIAPLHCWLTDLLEKASLGTAILFVAPMTGVYAMVRLILPITPDWMLQTIAVLSIATAVYAGGMAIVQHEARRFFTYLFLSNSALILVGLELATPIGLTGALCVWLSVGLSLTGFGLVLRCIEARAGRISLDKFHGYYGHIPTLAAFFLLTGLASIGFPGTIGFIGAELLIEGTIGVYPLIGTAIVIAAALNGIGVLKVYFRIFGGRQHDTNSSIRAQTSEKVAVMILTGLIVIGGLFPQWGITSRYRAAMELIQLRSDSTNGEPAMTTELHAALPAADKKLAAPPTDVLGLTRP